MTERPKINIAEIRERVRREQSCPRHHFEIGPGPYSMGARYQCAHCGAQKRMYEIGDYVRGYEAAGGNPQDICPDWKKEPTR